MYPVIVQAELSELHRCFSILNWLKYILITNYKVGKIINMDKNWTNPELLLGKIQNLQLSHFLDLKAKKQSCDSNINNNDLE